MKKFLSILLMLCLFANISFAFDPYADEEVEKKSYKKLYYGIVLTLVGGFLAYDGFSTEEVDVSKPNVDYTTVLHSEWSQQTATSPFSYELKSGWTEEEYYRYNIDNQDYYLYKDGQWAYNTIYNNGNVDLYNVTIEVRYKNGSGKIITDERPQEHSQNGETTTDGYHIATKTIEYTNITLKKGQNLSWQDVWIYTTEGTNPPNGNERHKYTEDIDDGTTGLNLGKDALNLMDIRVILNKNQQYKPIYEKRHKSDIEGVAGIMVGLAGIYLIVDHFVDMHKFNTYAKRHDLNFKIATASNEYKLMLQKRI